MSKQRLTEWQLRTLAELGEHEWEHHPASKETLQRLIVRGYVTRRLEGLYKEPTYKRTPLGTNHLKDLAKKADRKRRKTPRG